MGWLHRLFGRRGRRLARVETHAAVRAAIEAGDAEGALERAEPSLLTDADDDELVRLTAEALRRSGEPVMAVRFDRVADAPHDPGRALSLGSALLSDGSAELGAAFLERALRLAPFDAVIRSELALAYARGGRPTRVLEVLALHPCLAEDSGALFEFGWASLLCGDTKAARGALGELRGAGVLKRKLALALERAELGFAQRPPDARDFYFLEHGGLVLASDGPLAGRHRQLALDGPWLPQALSELAWVLASADDPPKRIVAGSSAVEPIVAALADACGAEAIGRGRARLPAALVVLEDGEAIDALSPESRASEVLTLFALTLDYRRPTSRAPDFVGAFTAETTGGLPSRFDPLEPSDRLAAFVEPRRRYLPPGEPRGLSAFVPDAPLPR